MDVKTERGSQVTKLESNIANLTAEQFSQRRVMESELLRTAIQQKMNEIHHLEFRINQGEMADVLKGMSKDA